MTNQDIPHGTRFLPCGAGALLRRRSARPLYLIGRGESITEFTPDADADLACVSSGIFARLPRRPDMWIVGDSPSSYEEENWKANNSQYDYLDWWPVVDDQEIQRIMLGQKYMRNVHWKLERYPVPIKRMVRKAIRKWERENGRKFQPDACKYEGNIVTFDAIDNAGPNFVWSGPLGMSGLRNTMPFAVQVASQLGYRKIIFAGCDFKGYWPHVLEKLEKWHSIAVDFGIEWFVDSEQSMLSAFLPRWRKAAAA